MFKSARILLIVLAVFLITGCGGGGDSGGSGGTMGGTDVGATEELNGSFTFDGVTFTWTVQGDMVQVGISVMNTQYFLVTLASFNPKANFEFSFATGHTLGLLVLNPKTATSNGSLEAKNLTVTQSGQTRTFTGIMGTW